MAYSVREVQREHKHWVDVYERRPGARTQIYYVVCDLLFGIIGTSYFRDAIAIRVICDQVIPPRCGIV